MPTNDFLSFAGGGGANVITQASYAALTTLLANGFSTGTAQSAQLNKVWRQSSIMAAVLAQFIVDETGQNATDDGTTATLLTNLKLAIGSPSERIASAGGTADALSAVFTRPPTAFVNGLAYYVRASFANATTTPSFTPNSGTLAAKTIVKGSNQALNAGDIAGPGHWIEIQYDATLDKWVMLNPASGIAGATSKLQPLTVTQASNILTGAFASSTLDYRSQTASNGASTTLANGPLTLAIPAASNLGMLLSGQTNRLIWLVAYNAGSPVLCVVNQAGEIALDETGFISPTTISGTSNSANTVYSASAVAAGSPYRVVGFSDVIFTTGTGWSTPTLVQGVGGQALNAMSSLGYGQTWQDVSGSRVLGTTYYNTTGKPIAVNARNYSATATNAAQINVGGQIFQGPSVAAGSNINSSIFAIVPPGQSYVVTGTGASPVAGGWVELR